VSAPVNGYLEEEWFERRVFEGEDFLEEKFFASAEAYAAARAEHVRTGYREMTGMEQAGDNRGGEA
jgi:hypothetical protein